MNRARYRINGQTYLFVAVNRLYWTLERASDGTYWRAYGQEIRPRMTMTAEPEQVTR